MQTTKSLGESLATNCGMSSAWTVCSLPDCGSSDQPIVRGIDAHDLAFHLEQAAHECLGDVAGAEHDDAPRLVIVRLEVQLHHAAAGHADVALQVPLDQLAGRRIAYR